MRAFAGLPLIANDHAVGVLSLLFGNRAPFTSEEQELMELLADHAAIAIRNAELFARECAARDRAERSQQRFRDLVQDLDAIVWEADAATLRFSFVSQRAERILGYPAEQWLQEPDFWVTHLHPDDREATVALCRQATAEGRDHEFEYRMVGAEGQTVWFRDLVRVIRDAEGRALWSQADHAVNMDDVRAALRRLLAERAEIAPRAAEAPVDKNAARP